METQTNGYKRRDYVKPIWNYSEKPKHTYHVYTTPIKRAFNLFRHYFMVIDGFEFHRGFYSRGQILPIGTTKNAVLHESRTICSVCYKQMVDNYNNGLDGSLMKAMYPFINCETMTKGVSKQVLFIGAFIPLIVSSIIYKYWILVIVIILCLLIIIQLIGYRFKFTKCKHLKK